MNNETMNPVRLDDNSLAEIKALVLSGETISQELENAVINSI